MIVFTERGNRLETAAQLGVGGEGSVFAVQGDAARVVKLYASPTAEAERRLRALINYKLPPGVRVSTAWPEAIVVDASSKQFVGFVMPRFTGRALEDAVLAPLAPVQRVGIAIELATLIAHLHSAGVVVGDLNETNVLLCAGRPRLIDADSFGVPGCSASAVAQEGTAAPELARSGISPATDQFALAVLLFQILLAGRHPFAGKASGKARMMSTAKRIASGISLLNGKLAPPKGMPALDKVFPATLLDAFSSSLLKAPAQRLAAHEWITLLKALPVASTCRDRHPQFLQQSRCRATIASAPTPVSVAPVAVATHRPPPTPSTAGRSRAPRPPSPASASLRTPPPRSVSATTPPAATMRQPPPSPWRRPACVPMPQTPAAAIPVAARATTSPKWSNRRLHQATAAIAAAVLIAILVGALGSGDGEPAHAVATLNASPPPLERWRGQCVAAGGDLVSCLYGPPPSRESR